jgi:hypothetical protein
MKKLGSLAHAVGRGSRPRKRWNWVHFACGFAPVAILEFFDTGMPFFSSFWPHLAETLVVGTLAGSLTALFGERSFEGILRTIARS